jgi:hypothetical protein
MQFTLTDLMLGVLFVALVAGATRLAAHAEEPPHWGFFVLIMLAIVLGIALLGRFRRRQP